VPDRPCTHLLFLSTPDFAHAFTGHIGRMLGQSSLARRALAADLRPFREYHTMTATAVRRIAEKTQNDDLMSAGQTVGELG
jgi:hypothetical protein